MIHIGWTTIDNREDAEKLARGAIVSRLAACAQVDGPVRSFYLWQGEEECADEYRITFKFASETSVKLANWLQENHPYATPQWITVSAQDVSAGYRQWVRDSQGLAGDATGSALDSAIDLSRKGNRLLRKGDFQEAERVLREAYELDPDNAYILVGLGDLYREQKKFDKAINYYEKILTIDEKNVFALRGAGDALRGKNQHERAISCWKRYLECNEDDIQVLTRVGDSYKKLKEYGASEKYYCRALEINGKDKYALLGVGSLFYKQEKDDKALHYLERLLELDDGYVAVLTMVGNIYRRRQEYERAIAYYAKAVELEPGNTFALYGLGDCNRWMKNYDEVVRWWGMILEKEPRNQIMHSRVGDACLNTGDHEKAMEHYQISLRIRFDPYACLGMARILRHQGKYPEAVAYCQKVLEQTPNNPRILEELAEVYREMGEIEKGAEILTGLSRPGN
ncbi:MAG: divalent cation tolerance protein CutA [Desulfobulbales bacterium]|nr:divalent cation tolerance protein CutA [Desulfobulbales bacterium]